MGNDDNLKLYINKIDTAIDEMCETLRVGDSFVNPRSKTMRDWFYIQEKAKKSNLTDKLYLYKEESEKGNSSLNTLLEYALNHSDYTAVMTILKKSNPEKINYEEDSLGMNAFMSAIASRNFRKLLNLDTTPQLRDVVNNLSMLYETTKHMGDNDKAFLSTVLINDEIKKDGVLQEFSRLTTTFVRGFMGILPNETMESFKNHFKRYDRSLNSLSLPVPLESFLDKKVEVLSNEIMKLSGRLKGTGLSINCLVDLQEVAKRLKSFDQRNNLWLIKNSYDKLINVFVPGSDCHDLLNDVVEPNVRKIFAPEEKMVLNDIRKSVLLFLKLTLSFETNSSDEEVFLKDCKKIAILKTDDAVKSQIALGYLRAFKKDSEQRYNKVLGSVLNKMEDYCANNKELSMMDIEGLDKYFKTNILERKIGYLKLEDNSPYMCIEAKRFEEGEWKPYVIKDTSKLLIDEKRIKSAIKNVNVAKEIHGKFMALDNETGLPVCFSHDFNRLPVLNFNKNNSMLKEWRESGMFFEAYFDLEKLNEVASNLVLENTQFLKEPCFVTYKSKIGILENLEVEKEGIKISLIELNLKNVYENPNLVFEEKSYVLKGNDFANDLKIPSETKIMVLFHNLMMAKNNLLTKKLENTHTNQRTL